MGVFSAAIALLSKGDVSQLKRPLGSPSDNEVKTKSTILVIDEDPMVLQTIKSLLVKRDVTVLTSSSARKGLEMFHYAARDIRIVVLDYDMAKLNGVESVTFINRHNVYAAVIGLTAKKFDSLPREYIDSVDKLLSKPIATAALFGAVDELLGIEQMASSAIQA